MKTEKQSKNQKLDVRPEVVRKKIKTEKNRKVSLPASIEIFPASATTPGAPQEDIPPTFLAEGEMLITEGAVRAEEEMEEGEVMPPPPPSQYKCSECDARYTDKAQWKNHFNSQHGGKIFPRSLRPFKGTKREDLKSHV